MLEEPVRSRAAREMAERALVRVVHHYGSRPEFVVLGGLVPELLCSLSEFRHAGTTDVDVQVDLEIACGAVNAARLERALRNAEFSPDTQRVWRWTTGGPGARTVVKFELLADLDNVLAGAIVEFDGCQDLGAANLRGTRYASQDIEVRELRSRVGGVMQHVEINVAGLAGFLLAKCAAVQSDEPRRTGTTSPSCYCTTTPAVRLRLRRQFSTASVAEWTRHARHLLICLRTSQPLTPRERWPTRNR